MTAEWDENDPLTPKWTEALWRECHTLKEDKPELHGVLDLLLQRPVGVRKVDTYPQYPEGPKHEALLEMFVSIRRVLSRIINHPGQAQHGDDPS